LGEDKRGVQSSNYWALKLGIGGKFGCYSGRGGGGGERGVHMSHPDPKMTSPKTSGPEIGAKFVIPTTTRNTCPTQIPR